MYPISTFKNWVINNYVAYIKYFYKGKKWEVLKSIHKPHCPSLQDSYNTWILQNSKHFCTTGHTGFQPRCELYQCTVENILKYHRNRHFTICKWWWLLRKCTIMKELYISWDYGCLLQQDRIRLFSSCFWLNILLHTSQRYGRSPVCIRLCSFRLFVLRNVLLHTSQRYGHSPVCTRLCTFRSVV